jgi:hypothetical protein
MKGFKSVLTPNGQSMPTTKATNQKNVTILTKNHLLRLKGVTEPTPGEGVIEDDVEV